MRGKGEGGLYRVPADRSKPLQYWTATIELPSYDGKRRRKVLRNKNKAALITQVNELREQLKKRGDLPTADVTVEQWFTHWYNDIVVKELRPATARGYKTVVYKHVIPTIGSVRLEKVTPTHIRRVRDHMIDDAGLTSTYALNAHRIMSSAFENALQENRIGRNPAKVTKAPRREVVDLDVLDLDEGLDVLEHLSHRPIDGAQRATSLLTGVRRGENIGLELDRVGDELDISWQLQRLLWAHGCNPKDPDSPRCGRKRGFDCIDRRLNMPKDYEYRRLTDGLYLTRPKSNAGWRVIPLVEPLRSILERHIAAQPSNPWGLVFTWQGQPIDPDQDSTRWKRTLEQVGITKDVKLHNLRHTAVDLLYLADVPEDIIIEIVGHSNRSMPRAYKSKRNRVRLRRAMEAMSALLTPTPAAGSGTLAPADY